MNILIAWIVVGVCCHYLAKFERDKYLPKYHGGMLFMLHSAKELDMEITPENVLKSDKWVNRMSVVLSAVFAPYVLYKRITSLFTKGPSEAIIKLKVQCDEFSKKHGVIF